MDAPIASAKASIDMAFWVLKFESGCFMRTCFNYRNQNVKHQNLSVATPDNAIAIKTCHNGNMKSDLNNTLPRRESKIFVKEWIAFRGTTAEKLAAEIGTSKGQMSKLISGVQRYNRDWLERIAYILRCDVRSLFRNPYEPSADELLEKLSADDRKTAVAILEAFVKDKIIDHPSE
ncbi:MAG: helix-turn-helix transcriptional regulator [Brucella anthropi]